MAVKTDEGDFSAMHLMIGMSKTASLTEENKNKSEMERFVEQGIMCRILWR